MHEALRRARQRAPLRHVLVSGHLRGKGVLCCRSCVLCSTPAVVCARHLPSSMHNLYCLLVLSGRRMRTSLGTAPAPRWGEPFDLCAQPPSPPLQ
jgi:hypothetical protein